MTEATLKPCRRIEGSASDEGHTVRCACGIGITAPTIGMADAVFAAHRRASTQADKLAEALEAIGENNWKDQSRARHVARQALKEYQEASK